MKKRIAGYLIAVVVFVLFGLIWWYAPKHLLDGVEASEIVYIEVMNKSTGNQFVVEDTENVGLIMRNLLRATYYKEGMSLPLSGDIYKLKVYDGRERMLGTFELHSEKYIKLGTFFYISEDVTLCKELITQIEKEIANEGK